MSAKVTFCFRAIIVASCILFYRNNESNSHKPPTIAGKDLRYIVRVRPVVVESFQFLNQYSKKFSKKQEKSE